MLEYPERTQAKLLFKLFLMYFIVRWCVWGRQYVEMISVTWRWCGVPAGVKVTLSALIDGKNFNAGGHKVGMGFELEA